MQSDPIILVLPLPPSANKLWQPGITRKGKAGLFKRDIYETWTAEAKTAARLQAGGRVIGEEYHLHLVLPLGRGDPDNCIKALQDACQAAGVIRNDKLLRRLVLDVDVTRETPTALLEFSLPDGGPIPCGGGTAASSSTGSQS